MNTTREPVFRKGLIDLLLGVIVRPALLPRLCWQL